MADDSTSYISCVSSTASKRLRIANVIEEGRLGGPQIRMVRVAVALQGKVETMIVMPRVNSGEFRTLCENVEVPYRIVPLTRITKGWSTVFAYFLFFPIEVIRLARLFQNECVDIVHASGGSWQYKAVVAAKIAGVPSIWHLNDTLMPRWIRIVFSLLQSLATSFIFASNRSCEYYSTVIDHRPWSIVPATVDSEQFHPNHPVINNTALPVDIEMAPVIGTVANISPVKGIEDLVRAIAMLQRRWPDLRVVVIGAVHDNQRAYYARVMTLARELGVDNMITWMGALSDVRPVLARMDVYLCTSLAESSPVSVWEAMAMARPVVSTDVGDVAHHVRDGESGFIVSVGNPDTISERVAELLESPVLRATMGRRAREIVLRNFTPEIVAAKTLSLYQKVAGDRPRSKKSRSSGQSEEIK